jgi:hypothetical protein
MGSVLRAVDEPSSWCSALRRGCRSADVGVLHQQDRKRDWQQGRRGADGKVPAVGTSVNLREATYTNSIGAPRLSAFWRDPEFDPSQKAFHYVRVLEIPTLTWLVYDRKNFNLYDEMPDNAPCSSPIWYSLSDG